MRAAFAAAALSLLPACAPPPPPAPPPFAGAPAGPPAELGEAPKVAPIPSPTTAPAEPTPPAAPAPPNPTITLEPAFRLDRRIFPPTRAEFLADLADRTRWNKGDMGPLAAPLPPVPGHPAPKVILDVPRGKGPLPASEAQRVLRRNFWTKAVECFGLGAYKDQSLRGTASLALSVSAGGKITAARTTNTTFKDEDVPHCLATRIRTVPLPRARAGSTVSVDLQISHGDEPMPPPATLIVPGEGDLTPEAIGTVVEAALPSFEACYRAALEYAPELWGRLGIRFHVTEKGKTDEAFEAESQFPDERMTLCVLRAARKLTFPKPTGGDLRFIVPLRFRSDRSPVPAQP